MSISILGGHAKGRALFVPKGSQTRPTTVMLRRKFFDAHQDCSGMNFIDLCAGTGAMGFEAASRGAQRVTLVELHKQTYKVLEKNKNSLSRYLSDTEITSYSQDILAFLKGNLSSINHEDTVLFFDPPYEMKELYSKVFELLKDSSFQGEFWVESDRQKGLKLEEYEGLGLEVLKVYKQGTSYIARLSLNS